VAKTKPPFTAFARKNKSPALLAGLVGLLLILSGCQTATTPEEVTNVFWEALMHGDIESAKRQATQQTQQLVGKQQPMENSSLRIGQIIINVPNATVETIITENNKTLSFNTVLFKENNHWKVDYQQTLLNISNEPFSGIIKNLQNIGDIFNKQLEQQIPLIEKEIESFGEELKQQLDEFGRNLEKSKPPKKQQPYRDTI
jgi:hypothetical protein